MKRQKRQSKTSAQQEKPQAKKQANLITLNNISIPFLCFAFLSTCNSLDICNESEELMNRSEFLQSNYQDGNSFSVQQLFPGEWDHVIMLHGLIDSSEVEKELEIIYNIPLQKPNSIGVEFDSIGYFYIKNNIVTKVEFDCLHQGRSARVSEEHLTSSDKLTFKKGYFIAFRE